MRRTSHHALTALAVGAVVLGVAVAAAGEVSRALKKRALVELYTSQG